MDQVKQAQAYLLAEAVAIHNLFRKNSNNTYLIKRPLLPLIALSTAEARSSPSTVNSSNRKKFLELPDAFLNSLTPEIKVYKTYINPNGDEYSYLLPMGAYLESTGEVEQGVVVKSAEFTRLGGNPAEINTNIKFNLKLFARDITTFFTKNEVMPTEGGFTWTPPPEFAYTVAQSNATHNTILDLEQAQRVNQDTLNAPVRDARLPAITPQEAQLIAESQANIERRISRAMRKLTRLNNKIDDLAQTVTDVAANGMRRVAWIDLIKIDPGQELEVERDNELVTSDNQVRIKVEIGYIKPTTKPINYNKNDWELWADVIEEQRETFYLSLFKHQFDFRGNEGIELSVDYIASGNAIQLSPRANLFDNPQMELRLKRIQKLIKEQEKEIKAANEQETQTEVTADCIARLQSTIANLEKRARDISSNNKLRLLNQIYLQGDTGVGAVTAGKPVHYSRVYSRWYNTAEDDSALPNRQYQQSYHFGDGNSDNGIQGRIGENTGNGRGVASIEVVDQNFVTDDDAAEESVTASNHAAASDGQKRTSNMFIFLGDIIDSAIEILVPTDHTTRHNLVVDINEPWSFSGDEKRYDWTYHPPMAWEAVTDAGSARERCILALTTFGGIVTGWVSYTNPNNIDQTKKIPMRDIPIALDIFRAWWINKFVKSGRNTLPLRDFLTELVRFVEKDVFKDIPIEYGTNTDKIDTPKFIINSNPVNGFSRIYDRIYNSALSLSDGMSHAFMSELAATFANSHEGASLFLTSIEQTENKPKLQPTTPTIVFGETAEGVLKHISFEREDIPGHAEARLFSDRTSVAGNIALREKYNTKIDLIGTTTLLPGSLLYIDPLPLDLGFAKDKNSLARALGLGGMYRVVNLTSTINFDAAANEWETTVNTKWESFSDGKNGSSAATNPSAEDLGITGCADLEAAAAENPDPPRPFTPTGGVCFAAGTEISMHDGTKKNIEDIVIGDTVLSWDEETNEITRGNVSGLNRPLHDDMVNLTWGNITNKNTFDHPFYVKGKGWCSYAPDLTLKRYVSFETVEKLETGDICYYINGSELEEIKLSNIEEEMGMIQTYIFSVEVYNTFFANNILTHNK